MLKLQYPICCGVDIHKNVIVATIVTTDSNGLSEYEQKSFTTINSDIHKFHDWLIKNNCYHVCMESTGKYWTPIFNYLEADIYLLENTADTISDKAIRKLIHKNTKASSDESFAAISGYKIETDQVKILELARAHLNYLEGMITQTEVELYVRIKPYWTFVELISELPGMSEISATIILAEICVNMDVFEDAKHLCSWCGLSPPNHESAGKKKSVRIAKAGAY